MYKYKLGSSSTPVEYGQNVKNWSTWDGSPDTLITCTSGQTLTLVEADANYKAQNSGNKGVTVTG